MSRGKPNLQHIDSKDCFLDAAMPWLPLLDGNLAMRAAERVREIAEQLSHLVHQSTTESATIRLDPTLAQGDAGIGLFFTYYERCLRHHEESTLRYACSDPFITRAVDTTAQSLMTPSLYGGFLGVAWVLEYHQQSKHRYALSENEIDDLILQFLHQTPATHISYELLTGLIGIGVYALERWPISNACRCLTRVIEQLSTMAQATPVGYTFKTLAAPQANSVIKASSSATYYCDLGLAHGIAGVIAFLGLVSQRSEALRQHCLPLLENTVYWLWQHCRSETSVSWFADTLSDQLDPGKPSRLAWCYGDVGIAVAMLAASRGAKRADWRRLGQQLAMHAARRSLDSSQVVDAGLCHGAAGLGHIFNRLYQYTGEPVLRHAACFWFEHALNLPWQDNGIAGFSAFEYTAEQGWHWASDPGFLSGAAGIGLALQAAICELEPTWDRVLLLSARTQR